MKRLIPFCAGALIAMGCQGSTDKSSPEAPAPVEAVRLFEEDPGTDTASKAALLRNGEMLTVGSDPEKAFAMFRGSKPGGFASERLPPNFGGIYKASIWQGATEGIGVITWKGKVVAAIYQEGDVTQERLNNEILPAYLNHFEGVEPEIFRSDKSTAYFWTETLLMGRQRVMIQAVQTPRNTLFVTAAMGDERVLDALDINPAKAISEQALADQIMGNQEAKENAALASER